MSQHEKNLRVAVIGLGGWGWRHLETYAAVADVDVVAVCDPREARLQEAQSRFVGVEGFTTSDSLWERDDIDLVSVVTPEHLHRDAVVKALHSGKHVLVEKAVATEVEDAEAMAQAANETGQFLIPGHILRFDSRYAEVKRHLELGSIGDVVSIFSRRFRPQSQFAGHGTNHTAFVQMPHDIDLALWWAGSRVARVRATERRVRQELRVVESDAPDVLWATLEFENGIVAVLHGSWLLPSAARVDMGDYAEVMGSHGVLKVQTSDGGFSLWSDDPKQAGRHSPDFGIDHQVAGQYVGALRTQLSYLCQCIREGRTPDHVSFDDAVHGVAVARAMVESASSGRDVIL